MDARHFLFSFRGRITRADFWFLALVAAFIWGAIVFVWRLPVDALRGLLALPFLIVGLVVWFSAATRRLHDRGKSAWYLLLFIGLPSILLSWQEGKLGLRIVVHFTTEASFIDLVCTAIYVWMVVELGGLRGTAGPNPYGANPSRVVETESS